MAWTPCTGDRYLDWEEIVAFCEATAAAFPDLVELHEIGRSREGRPILLLGLGERSGRRPAFWLDGGTHATEWAGVVSTLYTVSRWLQDPATLAWLRDHAIHVLPCISPDGLAYTRRTGAYLRSNKQRSEGPRRGWEPADLDGDGVVRWLRWRHPAGPWVQDPEEPLACRPRTLDDPPESAFFLANEGSFVGWDGLSWADAPLEHGLDLNRNFPGSWEPFSMYGMHGGDSPMSEPESRAVVDAFRARMQVSVAISNHTYTGCLLTQPYREDSPLGKLDLRMMHLLATDAVAGTGWRVFRTWPEFTYDPKKLIVGVWADSLATLFGVAGYTLELWDPWAHAGIELQDPAKAFSEPDPVKLAGLVRAMAREPGTRPWTPMRHPQLGDVEVGGIDAFRTVSNPPEHLLAETCERAFRIHDRARRALPELHAELSARQGPLHQVQLLLENRGFWGSGGLARAAEVGIDRGIRVQLEAQGLALLEGEADQALPALPGWGEARAGASLLWPDLGDRSPRAALRWVLAGEGEIVVRWSSLRAGSGEQRLRLGA